MAQTKGRPVWEAWNQDPNKNQQQIDRSNFHLNEDKNSSGVEKLLFLPSATCFKSLFLTKLSAATFLNCCDCISFNTPFNSWGGDLRSFSN